MTKSEFGHLLQAKLETNPGLVELSRWVFGLFNESSRHIDVELKDIMLDIARMEDAPEFEFSMAELAGLAEDLKASSDTIRRAVAR